jgi:hypothetical protein
VREITNLTIRFHRDELAELHTIANENGVTVGIVCRQFIRHFLTERRQGRPAPVDLGAIAWRSSK